MKENINKLPRVGDRVECLYMAGESDVIPGTIGKVRKITPDPILPDTFIIDVMWENGSSLNLLTDADRWRWLGPEKITESNSHTPHEFFAKNTDIFDFFDWRWFKLYLEVLRDSGIVNMFGARPFLYMGKEHLERYYGEGNEDNESFQELLELADTSRDKIIQGVVKYLESTGKDWDVDEANRKMNSAASKIVELYWFFH